MNRSVDVFVKGSFQFRRFSYDTKTLHKLGTVSMGIRIYRSENLYLKNQNSSHGPQERILANQESAIISSRLGLVSVPRSNLWWSRYFEGSADEKCRLRNLQIWFSSVGSLGQSRLGNHSPAGWSWSDHVSTLAFQPTGQRSHRRSNKGVQPLLTLNWQVAL